MKPRKEKTNRLLLWALVSCSAFFLHASGIVPLTPLNPLLSAGCAAQQPQTAVVVPDMEELPPVGSMTLESTKEYGDDIETITVERSEIVELTFVDQDGAVQESGPVPFVGLNPSEGTLAYMSGSSKESVPVDSVKVVVRSVAGRPGMGAAIGLGIGAVAGGAIGAFAGTGSGSIELGLMGALCIGAPSGAVGGTVVGGLYGLDTTCDIGSGEWRIVMPPAPTEPDDDGTPQVVGDVDAGPAPVAEPFGDAAPEAVGDGGVETSGDAGIDGIVDSAASRDEEGPEQ